MQPVRTTSAIDAHLDFGRHVVYRILPILGTGLLLYLLSGGLPPTTWSMLFRVAAQLSRLQDEQGIFVAWFALLLLIVQSLLLAFAWGVLLWLAGREGRAFIASQTGTRQERPPAASMPVSLPSQPALAPASPTLANRWWTRSGELLEQPTRTRQISRPTIDDQTHHPERKKRNYQEHYGFSPEALLRLLTICGCVGVGAILFWITGGFPPAIWRVLGLAIVRFGLLQQQQGSGAIFTLLLLIFQALCIGAAWGILLWLVWREGKEVLASLQTTPRVATISWSGDLERESSLPNDTVQAKKHPQAPPLISPFEGSEVANPFESGQLPAISRDFMPPSQTYQSKGITPVTRQEYTSSPFEERRIGRERTYKILDPAELSLLEQKSLSTTASGIHETLDEEEKQAPEPPLTAEEGAKPEAGHFSTLLHELHFFGEQPPPLAPLPEESAPGYSRHAASDAQSEPRRGKGGRSIQKLKPDKLHEAVPPSPQPSGLASARIDPFDVQSDVVDLFGHMDAGSNVIGLADISLEGQEPPSEQHMSPEAVHEQEAASTTHPEQPDQQPAAGETQQHFVYGNPFDGELPDVFYHDEDLKRELRDQLAEQHKDNAPHHPLSRRTSSQSSHR